MIMPLEHKDLFTACTIHLKPELIAALTLLQLVRWLLIKQSRHIARTCTMASLLLFGFRTAATALRVRHCIFVSLVLAVQLCVFKHALS